MTMLYLTTDDAGEILSLSYTPPKHAKNAFALYGPVDRLGIVVGYTLIKYTDGWAVRTPHPSPVRYLDDFGCTIRRLCE